MGKPKPKLCAAEEDMEDIHVICPNCGQFRIVKMYWSGGNVTPRIRCNPCKVIVSKRDLGMQVHKVC